MLPSGLCTLLLMLLCEPRIFFPHFLAFHFHCDTSSLLTTVWSNHFCVSLPDYTFLKCYLEHATPGGLPNKIWACHQGLWWLCPASFLALSPGSVCTLWCCPAGPPGPRTPSRPGCLLTPCPPPLSHLCPFLLQGPWSLVHTSLSRGTVLILHHPLSRGSFVFKPLFYLFLTVLNILHKNIY